MKDLSHYTALADIFRYPSEKSKDHIIEWQNTVTKYDPELLKCLDPFLDHLKNTTLEYQQEYYVSTFYVQPLCCLDIGYVLFGEDFRRGQFLANLKAEHRKAGNDCGTELPDNLPVLLTLLPKVSESDFAEELVFSLIIPAVREVISGFRSPDNHYKALLMVIASIMEMDFPTSKFERFQFNHRRRRIEQKPAEKTMPE